jgi:putative tryptophan/tyrosine transport system substrate-binding protein
MTQVRRGQFLIAAAKALGLTIPQSLLLARRSGDRMRRRVVLLAVLGAMPALRTFAFAQPHGRVWRIGFLAVRGRPSDFDSDSTYGEFVRGMRELGYMEGVNLHTEWRFADSQYERLAALAEELAKMNLDVIVTHSTPATQALQRATRTLPIVSAAMGDPVGSGFAASLARPGGNITGLSLVYLNTSAKQLELLKNILPQLSRVAFLINPGNPINLAGLKQIEAVSHAFEVTVLAVHARTADDIERAFASMRQARVEAVVVANDAFFLGQKQQLAELALKSRIASVFAFSDHVKAGGLASYGENVSDVYRRTTIYVDRILKGAKPSELPIEQLTKPELVINAAAAKALGLAIPASVLVRADRAIE